MDCTCRCEGKYHGVEATTGWKLVGDTTLIRIDDEEEGFLRTWEVRPA
jgi:hypothetical protein